MTPAKIVDAHYQAYNARNAQALAAFYFEGCTVTALSGNVTLQGRAVFQARFVQTFAQYPQNRAWCVKRIVLGNLVIDHESGERAPGVGPFEAIAVYTVRDGLITRLAMGRGE